MKSPKELLEFIRKENLFLDISVTNPQASLWA